MNNIIKGYFPDNVYESNTLNISNRQKEAQNELNELNAQKKLDTQRGASVYDMVKGHELQITILEEQLRNNNTLEIKNQINQLSAALKGLQKIAEMSEKYHQGAQIINTPPKVAAYVIPGVSSHVHCSSNPHDLATLDWEQIFTHEMKHLQHFRRNGSMDLPGFDRLEPYHQALMAREFGISRSSVLSEREWIEGFTELAATYEAGYNEKCAYNSYEVPLTKRFARLAKQVTGSDVSRDFASMKLGSFGENVLWTANFLTLAETARQIIGGPLNQDTKEILRLIGKDLIKKDTVISGTDAAKKAIKNSPVAILQLQYKSNKNTINILDQAA